MCDAHRDQTWKDLHRDYVLVCTHGWEVEIRDGQTVTLGRSATESAFAGRLAEFRFVSGRHASLTSREGRLLIRDHDSRNGTRIRDRRVEPETDHILVPGDRVTLGGQVVLYVR